MNECKCGKCGDCRWEVLLASERSEQVLSDLAREALKEIKEQDERKRSEKFN